MLEVELPFPPSVNHYWRHFRGRMVISEQGRSYREKVQAVLAATNVRPANGRVAVRVEAFPPDRRRRDLDNLLKALCDALEHGGAFVDDSQIVWLLIRRATIVPGGKVVVRVRERP
ncbi:MAG: RusA family crossover junction endodeoxyribonuclease [Phycisphaeraceae bacterium]|nr:RusA family crossover junction endodeoxyribonuclease [Phycisphaeraceae bacterium]